MYHLLIQFRRRFLATAVEAGLVPAMCNSERENISRGT